MGVNYRYLVSIRPRVIAIMILGATTTGCIGETSRTAFHAEVQARGGGVADSFIEESLTALNGTVSANSVEDIEVLSLTFNPGSRTVSARVVNSPQHDLVDQITISQGKVVSVEPVQNVDIDEIAGDTVRLGKVPLDRIEELVDVALREFSAAGAFVDQVVVTATPDGPVVRIGLDSERETATAIFDASGTLLEID